jgi:hypothetical protein
MNMESQSQTLYHKTIRLVDDCLSDHGGDQKGLFYHLMLSSVNFPTYRIEQRVRHSVLSTHHTTVITIVSSISFSLSFYCITSFYDIIFLFLLPLSIYHQFYFACF